MTEDILTPFLDDADVILYAGDCIEVMKRMPASSVDAIVTDPPYGLEFMGRAWDGFGTPVGFQTWTEAWAVEAFRILKPGGHLLAFAGTRTYHRMASGVEDAGFEIRDCIAWMYGSGFPKSLDVSKAIDKGIGQNRARQLEFTAWMRSTGITARQVNEATGTAMGNHYTTHLTQPAIATADMFDKFRSLLPEVPERIERLVAERTGIEWSDYVKRKKVGEAMMVDTTRSRLGFAGATYGGDGSARMVDITEPHSDDAARWNGWGTALKPAFEPIVVARRPLIGTVAQNVLEHGVGALNIDGCRIEGDMSGGGWGAKQATPIGYGGGREDSGYQTVQHSAGRWPANVALDATAAAMLDEQSGEQRSMVSMRTPNDNTGYHGGWSGLPGVVSGYADTGGASRFFYTTKASRQDRNAGGLADNTHPTVKPTDLMRWLIRLVTPPGGIILDPFGGSGSTGLAARAENVRCILIEREPEYLQIIRDRLAQQNLFADRD